MTDRPIPFSGPMVRALLDGRKTMTRRLESSPIAKCRPGDRLWMREAWRMPSRWDDRSPSQTVKSCLAAGYRRAWAPIAWEADGERTNWADWRTDVPGRYRHARHLPRAFSRLTLTVTAVRVERLQAITEDDALAEGVSEREEFRALWTLLHGPDAWAANPWVAAVSFTVQYSNIDDGKEHREFP